MADHDDNGSEASLDNDLFDVVHYKVDKKGRTNYLTIGRAWAKPDNDKITVKFFAMPIPNQDGDVLVTLIPRV